MMDSFLSEYDFLVSPGGERWILRLLHWNVIGIEYQYSNTNFEIHTIPFYFRLIMIFIHSAQDLSSLGMFTHLF